MAGGGTIEGGPLSSLTRASVESFLAGHASLSAQLLAGESVSTAVVTPGSAAQTHEGGGDAARQLAEQVEHVPRGRDAEARDDERPEARRDAASQGERLAPEGRAPRLGI